MKQEIPACLAVNGSSINGEEEEAKLLEVVEKIPACLSVNGSSINGEEEEAKVSEVVEKEQQRGKRQRSGAQKRKLRMQRALAAGEKVIPRSERSQRGRAPAKVAPNSRPVGATNGKLEVSPGEEAGHSEPGQNPSDGPASPCGDPTTSVRMAVVCRGFPSVKITEEQHDALQDALLDRIELSGGTQPLQFLSARCSDGASYFICANKWTAVWLEETIPDISPWGGARLKVGPANAVMRLAKVLVWIPKPASKKGTPEILALLQKQNIGVPSAEWKAVSRKDADDGTSLVLVIDEKSYRALRGYKFKLYLGMGQVSFKILTRPPGFN
ncbi:uncharacterized protein LOC126108895 [Schistocerca cancellata]|uniref:uncharacterized protein LOC126108895 n=1 Tax=Schistocerca cancellata TaxID=274614 RepID=UPI0021184A01|nr:uncharacterized protein LOC126108895 [Schistocerca cancellata]